jgi:hypothetical protein
LFSLEVQMAGEFAILTLQKSMDLTPFEPKAGPTGGDGDACPAPTMSLTIWSFAKAFRAIFVPSQCGEHELLQSRSSSDAMPSAAEVEADARSSPDLPPR